MKLPYAIFLFLLSFVFITQAVGQTKDLLTPEENLWLKNRNKVIVFYPEQNNPPYAYQNSAGNIQGLSIDYLDLIAEKIGAKIEYLTPRSRTQVLEDMRAGKGDVATLTPDSERESYLRFTESYITVPAIIVIRKDADKRMGLTPNDFNGKRVALVDGSAIESYIRKNYPRIVIEEVTDDEVSLQQIVLGEVDAAVMDVASLSYYLSKQVLSSVKIAGNTGFEYKPAFAVQKDKAILQSILEKGLSQITIHDRKLLADKWIALPGETQSRETIFDTLKTNIGTTILLGLVTFGLILFIIHMLKHHTLRHHYLRKSHALHELKDEFEDLHGASKALVNELEEIKSLEADIQKKIKHLE